MIAVQEKDVGLDNKRKETIRADFIAAHTYVLFYVGSITISRSFNALLAGEEDEETNFSTSTVQSSETNV